MRDLEKEKGQAGLPQTQQLQILYYWDVHRNFSFFSLQAVVQYCSVENHQTTKKSFFNYSYTKFVFNFHFEKSLIKYVFWKNDKTAYSVWLSAALISALQSRQVKRTPQDSMNELIIKF